MSNVERFKCIIHGMYSEDVVRARDYDVVEHLCKELLDALEYVLEYTSEDDIKPEPLLAARTAIANARKMKC